jgi:hypothetical protein
MTNIKACLPLCAEEKRGDLNQIYDLQGRNFPSLKNVQIFLPTLILCKIILPIFDSIFRVR